MASIPRETAPQPLLGEEENGPDLLPPPQGPNDGESKAWSLVKK